MTAGDHTRTIVVSSSTHGSLSKFTLKRQVCLGCRAVLSDDALALCDHCAPRTAEIYARLLAGTNDLEARFNRLWTQCQRCQGSVVNEVLCTSRDCVRVLSACVVALGGGSPLPWSAYLLYAKPRQEGPSGVVRNAQAIRPFLVTFT